jgi:hypothetical protein
MRKSFFIISFLFVASVVRAEVLSWSVDLLIGNGAYETAQLFSSASNDSGFWTSANNIGNAIYKDQTEGYVVQYDSNVTPGTAFFFVKLFNSSGTFLSYSDAVSWDQLVADQHLVSGSAPEMSALSPWTITSTTVPEPTAMALLAMGLSTLLLRRKRVA